MRCRFASAEPIAASKAAKFVVSTIADAVVESHIGDASNPQSLLDVKLGITKLEEVLAVELDGHGGDDDVGGEEGDDDNDNNHHTLQAQEMFKKHAPHWGATAKLSVPQSSTQLSFQLCSVGSLLATCKISLSSVKAQPVTER